LLNQLPLSLYQELVANPKNADPPGQPEEDSQHWGEQRRMLEGPGTLDRRQPCLPLPVSLRFGAFLQDVGV